MPFVLQLTLRGQARLGALAPCAVSDDAATSRGAAERHDGKKNFEIVDEHEPVPIDLIAERAGLLPDSKRAADLRP